MIPCRRQCRVFSFLLMILLVAAPFSAYNREKPFLQVINPCSGRYKSYMKDWLLPFNGGTIRKWGVSKGLVLIDDRGPVVDDTAAYVGPYRSTIIINGLTRDGSYRLWIDFVRFSPAEKRPGSLLKIFAAAPAGESRCIGSVSFSDIGDSYYYMDIPRTISASGAVEIRFVEYGVSGSWGVWDIVVSTVGELPRQDDIPRDESTDLNVEDRIVQ